LKRKKSKGEKEIEWDKTPKKREGCQRERQTSQIYRAFNEKFRKFQRRRCVALPRLRAAADAKHMQ